MDAGYVNEQPSSSSVSNSSSSSSNLNNPPILQNSPNNDEVEAEEEEEEEELELEDLEGLPLSLPFPTSEGDNERENVASMALPPPISDNLVFTSPLLFSNNSTPPPSSSSSSSSSSHNPLIYYHHQHSDHSHHSQHSTTQFFEQQRVSSSPQQLPPLPPPPPGPRDSGNISDNNDIAETIDASTIEEEISLNVDAANAIGQEEQQLPIQPDAADFASSSAVVTDIIVPHASPSSLPLLLQNELKHIHAHASNLTHPYKYPFYNHDPSFGHYNNTFGFKYANSNISDMFATNSGPASNNNNLHGQRVDRIKLLYPNVNESETPLPRCWSSHDKCLSIGLSQTNLRVHYKGVGKQHNDAASVRTAYPIPPACGLYYFEVKIISKGKNGYMGIGLTAQQFRMNRLPGWDKQSYGYHGDDGHSFSSSGNGQSYGPTFTTGDIIGCCVNFVNNTCFYTKNGIDLGIAFRDLPTKLYPTVGLQTPGEEVNANFGQEPFKFDQIEDMMKQMRAEMRTAIYDFPIPADMGDPTTLLHKMVSSYLVHNGYSQTAEVFARTTGQTFQEEIYSIKNRQKILKLVMFGKIGQAIDHTLRLYPGLLENNKNLWFMLKCRQFIEMVNGSDIECCPANNKKENKELTATQATLNQTSVIQSTKAYQSGKTTESSNEPNTPTKTTPAVINNNHQPTSKSNSPHDSTTNNKISDAVTPDPDFINDFEMNTNIANGNFIKNGSSNSCTDFPFDEEMEVDVPATVRDHSSGIEMILKFGKELSQMGKQLENENKMNDEDRQMLEDAFSLIAYSNPWSSPLGWQLCPTKREVVCSALNSAILESMNFPRRPPLDVCVAHASELLKVMAQASLGASAFVNIEDVFPKN